MATKKVSSFKNSIFSKIIFVMSIMVFTLWYLSQVKNIYRTACGEILDALWTPMQLLLFALPLLSFILYIRDKLNPRSLYLYSFLLMAGMFLYLLYS